MSDGHVSQGEFVRAIEALSEQIADVKHIARSTLEEARKTNGRVQSLELTRVEHKARLDAIEASQSVTRRDLWVFGLAVSLVFAAIRWLPALVQTGGLAP
jgi:hypothetical protein